LKHGTKEFTKIKDEFYFIKRSDIIIDYINKIFCMDNLELMEQLPKGKIDLIYDVMREHP